ncbi:STAS domain-containing protein [Brevibacillus dissolubilis]|uniref:STAS domain-containing protein n=1 Tax=Brevibacillus dissolubilis TaxID=1844116 RepID=UPI00159BA157|nr:STAS domain-containing protein [Brevibacillus dissolubilis]
MIEIVYDQETTIIKICKERIYIEESTILRNALLGELDKGNNKITVDLSHVQYMDSSCLGVLVGVYKRAKERGGYLNLRAINQTISDLLEITHLNRVFAVTE